MMSGGKVFVKMYTYNWPDIILPSGVAWKSRRIKFIPIMACKIWFSGLVL